MPQRAPSSDADFPGVPARRAALRLLDAVLRQGLPLETALDRAASGLQAADRSLAHAIAATVLRWLVDLDQLIDTRTAKPLPSDAKARMVLRIALAGALGLGTPAHAAIATALPLLAGGPRRLVHGVFGAIMRSGVTLPPCPLLPSAAWARWRHAWGDHAAEAARSSLSALPPMDLSLADPATPSSLVELAGAQQIVPWQVRVPAGTSLVSLPGYAEGKWWVQDISASIAAQACGRGPGVALDLCAAPGGKTMALAAAGWTVTAVDQSEARLDRLRENLTRTKLHADLVAADIRTWAPPALADLVLLDAPCSATGVFRRHPDVLYRTRASAIADLAVQQAAMIRRAANWVRPGGLLVYAVCSLEPEEGEAIASAFLKDTKSFAIEPPQAQQLPDELTVSPQGWLRVAPGALADRGGADGFFIARFRRTI